jgi:DNA modification methylase
MVLLQGDAFHLPLADQSVHCVVTSPPYYGLRAYGGVEASLWPGGAYAPVPGSPPITVGCWRGTLGNEPEVALYIWHTLLWLREVRRILREDGVAWIVIGDSFSSGDRQGHGTRVGYKQQTNRGMNGTNDPSRPPQPSGYPQGSVLGIPQQVLLAAIADGWVVRNDVIWAKASPMPESVSAWRWQQARCGCARPHHDTPARQRPAVGGDSRNGSHVGERTWRNAPDPACPTCGGTGRLATEILRKGSWRHTRATETILMLTKGMSYFANAEAVREHGSLDSHGGGHIHSSRYVALSGRNDGENNHLGIPAGLGGRNPRNVMMPAPSPLGLAHYASFPPGLIEPLIRATCPERSCPTCGMGWAPMVAQTSHQARPSWAGAGRQNGCIAGGGHAGRTGAWSTATTVHGLRPACPHYCTCGPLAPEPGLLVQDRTCPRCAKLVLSHWTPGIVCDPFVGSGTTLAVARALSRHAIGVDRSWPYLSTIARQRLGLTDLAAWEGSPSPPPPTTYSDLPLFTSLAGTTPIVPPPPPEAAADATD